MHMLQITSGEYCDFLHIALLRRAEKFDVGELKAMYAEFKAKHRIRVIEYWRAEEMSRETAAGCPKPDIKINPKGYHAWLNRTQEAAVAYREAYLSKNKSGLSVWYAFVDEVLIGQLGFERVASDTLHLDD